MSFTKVAPAGIGTEPGTSIQIGDSLLHSTGIDLGSGTGIGASITRQGNATFTGIVTASSFSGDITGNVTGTATQLATNATGTNLTLSGNLGVGGVLTYEDVTNVDSIGIITARSSINVNNAAGSGIGVTINSGGINVAGVITATSFSGIDSDKITEGNTEVEVVDTGSDGHFKVTTENEERFRINSSGYIKLSGRNVQGSANGDKLLRIYQPSRTDAEEDVLLLQSYNQSGTNSIIIGGGDSSFNAATDISFRTAAINTTSGTEVLKIDSSGDVEIKKNNDAKTVLKGDSVGIGTTTTTGRNAGVSTTAGTLIFNSTAGELQVYNGRGWDTCSNIFTATGGNTTYTQGNYKVHVFTSNGDFVANGAGSVDVLVVAGGGGGGSPSRPPHNGAWAGGGGAGGVLYTPGHPLTPATYPVVIGAGGGVGSNGTNSTFDSQVAYGGGRGGGTPYPNSANQGGAGGSGGGGLGDHPGPSLYAGAGTSGQGNPGGLGIDPGGGPDNYEQGGGGGGAGEAGNTDGNGFGGDGRDMSAEFGTTYGESGVFGGGGAGGAGTSGASYNEGGLGGGGDSGNGHTSDRASQAGATNTGGGGGAGGANPGAGGQPGGPGIVLIRYLVN